MGNIGGLRLGRGGGGKAPGGMVSRDVSDAARAWTLTVGLLPLP